MKRSRRVSLNTLTTSQPDDTNRGNIEKVPTAVMESEHVSDMAYDTALLSTRRAAHEANARAKRHGVQSARAMRALANRA